ncbi:glycogen/starch/alpha-glucan phosphorylase [Desulfitobacterium metallireducens]|uniref:Alpha-1,4 glucan phosphorylase n=1 Tax=Desulfitobacterium metallireducens DSM 15288 TaxID=871968 RepID=W0E8H1_9FIRM|nr:glycogen/starch/alpha-glucan phosphorylase [Desulfitobacterium metallireducens]AHF07057.1 alpha-glucan phosphorylase [Desulfitobacterium metallireducens DSM 15288]
MFKDRESFKHEYVDKLIKSEGVLLEEATQWNKYVALVGLLRETVISYQAIAKKHEVAAKQVYYFSMEFLMGRLLKYYLINLGIEDLVRVGLNDLGIDLYDLLEQEKDPGLGNGGLGRLAACFMDSMAFLGINGHGNGIRYKYGMFDQRIINGYQHEVADDWLSKGFPWETRKPDQAVVVKFKGNVQVEVLEGKLQFKHENYEPVIAMPYDVPIMSYQNTATINTLRLWSAEPVPLELDLESFNRGEFQSVSRSTVESISYVLYPDDSSQTGKELRLKQEYFFVAAGLGSIVRTFKEKKVPWSDFTRWVAIHINDTHPTLCIPELMRIFIDEEGLAWEEAWKITVNTISFTNHTILPEALESWPIAMFRNFLPRIFMIVEEIERRFLETLHQRFPGEEKLILKTRIFCDGQVNMANLAVIGCSSINGVAALHTNILVQQTFKEFHRIFGYKFNNKTNGVNHRRFLLAANPSLSRLITESIGPSWIEDWSQLKNLQAFQQDRSFLKQLSAVKHRNKLQLIHLIKEKQDIILDPFSLFDVQVKRIHAYKRQLLNVLKIMHLYNLLQDNPSSLNQSYTFILGGKAAPGYYYAKTVIKLIHALARKLRQDPLAEQYLTVVFLENFNVSVGEIVYPAADVSEQISTASKEASGTGNMKFMMNGAVTLGTLDGANVEILDSVGQENMFVFGLNAQEVLRYYERQNYRSWDIYQANPEVHRVVDQLINGFFNEEQSEEFRMIYDSLLLYNDEFFVLHDFAAYIDAFKKLREAHMHQEKWNQMSLINIANSGKFSSDRAIREYGEAIWKV